MKKIISHLIHALYIFFAFFIYTLLQLLYFFRIPKTWKPFYNILAVAISLVGILLLAYLYYKGLKHQKLSFNNKPHWDIKRILFSLGMFILLIVCQVVMIKFFYANHISANQKELIHMQQRVGSLFKVLVILVAPFCEEIIFRGLFFNYFFTQDNIYSKTFGIIINGFLFAWLHDPIFSIFIYLYWVMGMILAFTYLQTKDLRYSILVHMLNNMLG